MILLDLFLGFFRVGCFSFGGAYGAIPLIRDVVLSYGWLDEEALVYFIAVSESTPGPIMVNLATYIGSSQAGFWGAAVATLAVVFPSFLVILLVAAVFQKFLKHKFVQAMLGGLKPCMIGIVFATGIYMVLGNMTADVSGCFNLRAVLLTLFLLAVLFVQKFLRKKKLDPIPFLLFSAFLGILIYDI